jgi:hypothetical protein
MRDQVFVSYSHRDKRWLDRVHVNLRPLEREGKLILWDDSRIRPGQDWRAEIDRALASAKVAVLLVSADFLASDFIANDELPALLAAAESEGAVILSVIVGPSLFLETPSISRFQAVNEPSKPLSSLSRAKQEEVLGRLARSIDEALAR